MTMSAFLARQYMERLHGMQYLNGINWMLFFVHNIKYFTLCDSPFITTCILCTLVNVQLCHLFQTFFNELSVI